VFTLELLDPRTLPWSFLDAHTVPHRSWVRARWQYRSSLWGCTLNFPLWFAPDQVRVITLNDDAALIDYAQPIVNELRANQVCWIPISTPRRSRPRSPTPKNTACSPCSSPAYASFGAAGRWQGHGSGQRFRAPPPRRPARREAQGGGEARGEVEAGISPVAQRRPGAAAGGNHCVAPREGVRPNVAAQFDDLALMKVLAAEGRGFIAVPTVALREAVSRYQFRSLGQASNCRVRFYAVTAERRIAHPAVSVITQHLLT
jgi:hypothetical protein